MSRKHGNWEDKRRIVYRKRREQIHINFIKLLHQRKHEMIFYYHVI